MSEEKVIEGCFRVGGGGGGEFRMVLMRSIWCAHLDVSPGKVMEGKSEGRLEFFL